MMQISLFDDNLDERFQIAIIEDLRRGNGFVNGKNRIVEIYKMNIPKNERMKLLKSEYGIGGYGQLYGISRYHDDKGIEITLSTGEKRLYNWSKVHDLIKTLINTGLY